MPAPHNKTSINNTNNPERINDLHKSRKSILKQIQKKLKELSERRVESILEEIEGAKDDTRMFKAVKLLTKESENQICSR